MERRHLYLLAGLLISSAIVAADCVIGRPVGKPVSVDLLPVEMTAEYPDAFEPDSLGFACTDQLSRLQAFFLQQKAPFNRSLLRETNGIFCHIYFEPTLPGFRAAPDNQPVIGIFFDIDGLSFVARRQSVFGDSLDVVKAILGRVKRPLEVTLGLPLLHEAHSYEEAKRFHFGGVPHRIRFRDNQSEPFRGWPQDYLKSGSAASSQRILVTRRVYQRDAVPDAGPVTSYPPLLESFPDARYIRSRLSWEGGDLQFIQHPGQPGKLILFYGRSSRKFWGRNLTLQEYAYVLKLEFGADLLVEYGDLVSHTDYFISFLPDSNIALVSEPLVKHPEIAEAARELLIGRFLPGKVPRTLELVSSLDLTAEEFSKQRKTVARELEDWSHLRSDAVEDAELLDRMEQYVNTACPDRPWDCVSPAGQTWLLESDPELLEQFVTAEIARFSAGLEVPRLLATIETQLEGFKPRLAGKVEAKVRELTKLGFRVVKVPRISGDAGQTPPWAGISYANALLVDRMLFVPQFGLGSAEDAIFAELQAQIPEYEVIPIYARHLLLRNGGAHCIAGIVRGQGASPSLPTD